MPTHTNIRITTGLHNTLWLHRHEDGCPAMTGIEICDALKKLLRETHGSVEIFTNLANRLVRTGYDIVPDSHRRADWFYAIDIDHCAVTVLAMSWTPEQGWREFRKMTVPEFHKFCLDAAHWKQQDQVRKRIRATLEEPNGRRSPAHATSLVAVS